jgi:hypothetical protein
VFPRYVTDSKVRIIAVFVVLSLAPIYFSAQSLTEMVKLQETAAKAAYLVVYRPGPVWLTGKSVMEQPLKSTASTC